MLGLTIGNSLSNTNDGASPLKHRGLAGKSRGYLPHPHAGGRVVWLPSDDSQMAFWTLEQQLEVPVLMPEHLAVRFCYAR